MIYNFDFRKSLGQNFLIDDNIVDNIANAIDYKENNNCIYYKWKNCGNSRSRYKYNRRCNCN